MFEWRQFIIISFFFCVCLTVVYYSKKVGIEESISTKKQVAEKNIPEQESYLKKVSFYLLKKEQKQLHLLSEELMINNVTKRSSFERPEGFFYTSEGVKIDFKGNRGLYRPEDTTFVLDEDVQLDSDESHLDSDHARYIMNHESFISEGNVKTQTRDIKTGDQIFVDSLKVHAWPSLKKTDYEGQVKGHIKRKRPYEPDIFFTSDSIYLDLMINQIRMEGRVNIKRQDVDASSRRGEIYLDNQNKKLKYYTLFDDVKVIEKLKISENQLIERKAFGEKLEGIISEEKLVLTGSPKVLQEDDVVKGNKITLHENNEVIEVEDASSNFNVKKKNK